MNHSRNPLAVASPTSTFFTKRPHPTLSLNRPIVLHSVNDCRFLNHRQSKPGPDRSLNEASRGFFLSYKADITP
jgi:hypothetical protein